MPAVVVILFCKEDGFVTLLRGKFDSEMATIRDFLQYHHGVLCPCCKVQNCSFISPSSLLHLLFLP